MRLIGRQMRQIDSLRLREIEGDVMGRVLFLADQGRYYKAAELLYSFW
jgi:hypothetical protein